MVAQLQHSHLERLVAVGTQYLYEKHSINLRQQILEAVSLTSGVLHVQKYKPQQIYLRNLDVSNLCCGHDLYVQEHG